MMAPMERGLTPDRISVATSCVVRIASAGFVIREPEAVSGALGIRVSVLRNKQRFCGDRDRRSQQVEFEVQIDVGAVEVDSELALW